jgi:glycosyltransferase involved in cell wall biosynthesis
MRIALIGLKGLPATWTGIEYHVDRLGRGLVARGHEVTAYVRPFYTPPGVAEHGGMRLVRLPTIRSKHLDATIHSLLASIHAVFGGYDVIHYHGIGPGFFGVIPRIFGRRVVCTVHRLDWQAEKWAPPARALLRLGELVSVHVAHCCVAVSTQLVDYVRAHHGRTAEMIPNGVESVVTRAPRMIAEKWGLEGKDYLLFMGRLSPEKRVDWLIRAFRAAVGDDRTRLVIAGSYNATERHVDELRSLAGSDPRIIFAGFVAGEEKEELLSNALAFVLPSRIEGMPVVLIEAMAAGCCCVASDIQPHRELIRDGVDGRLFAADDEDELVGVLRAVLADRQAVEAVGGRAQVRMRAHLSWDEVVVRTERLYQELVTGERR